MSYFFPRESELEFCGQFSSSLQNNVFDVHTGIFSTLETTSLSAHVHVATLEEARAVSFAEACCPEA